MLGAGATFAGYRVERVLGQGGMGTVYLAQHPRLPRSVALKLLNREVSTDPELVRRFEREADVIARLEHPGIVGVLDRGADDDHLWIAMQYIRGTDAASWDARAHPASTAVRLLGEIASALDFAHSRGVLHRDVKPANILISEADSFRDSRAVLTDFGIARLTDAAATKITATGTFTATLAYGSPEQLSGEVVDHRSDQYSLACTLFTLLTGQPPYASTNPGQVVMGHIAQPVPRLTAVRPDLPPTVDTVFERAMAKRRDDRFESCAEFVTAARDALDGRRIGAFAGRAAPTTHNAQHHGYAMASAPNPVFPAAGIQAAPSLPTEAEFYPAPQDSGREEGRDRSAPSRFSAFTAAITTLVVGLIPVGLFIAALGSLAHRFNAPDMVLGLTAGAAATLWVTAGISLLSGRRTGRVLTGLCSVIGLSIPVGLLLLYTVQRQLAAGLFLLFTVVFVVNLAALWCTLAQETGRWIDYRTRIRRRRR
ncbi:serine/threonine-protein kinase [Nocardia rhamnosiphila]|uniref:serine/threonine-protein kinase n=1 Tax=Nocardia rhamnosiphila TaxID=426716 RepID=UPI00068F3117|nr:serine/threonine-protein kinase [Nocardia rhamnosiphila]